MQTEFQGWEKLGEDYARLHSDEAQLIQQYRKLTERQKGRIDQQVDNFVDENKRSSHFAQSDDEMIQNLR